MTKTNTENNEEKRATLTEDLYAWAESTGFVFDDEDDILDNFIL